MKKFVSLLLAAILALTALSVFAGAVDGTAPAADVEVAYGTPVIDGTIDAVWANAKVYKYALFDAKNPSATISEDHGQFRLLWDENYIYLLAEIKDSTIPADSVLDNEDNWHTRDKLAVCIGVSETGYFWFGIRPNNSVPNFDNQPRNVFITEDETVTAMAAHGKLPADKADTAMFKAVRTADGYLVESKINVQASNKAGAADFKYEAGTVFGFDSYVYDNDQEKANQDHVYPFFDKVADLTSYKSNATKAKAVLLAKTEPVTTTEAGTTAATDPATTTANVPSTPSTGDMTVFFVVLAVLAVAGTAIVIVSKRVKN
ncbi:MAG: hypothetical protein K5647_06140 [Clostridiales bacterium]|nr:hypothetical protein [Clostridiales bacterium]